jgi:glycosyltransferase involved in cell wall biosynthesis
MKILIVITGLGVGGAERQVVDLADRFVSQGHSVTLAHLLEGAQVWPRDSRVVVRSLGGDKTAWSMAKAFFNLLKIVREQRPDVVHSHMYHANIFSRVARLFVFVPRLICTAHSTNEGGGGRMMVYRITNSLADLTTNVSAQAVAEFERRKAVPKGLMVATPNGIDTTKFRFRPEERLNIRSSLRAGDSPVVLAVGRMVPAKNYPLLLLAFNKVLKNVPNATLWIAGNGPLREFIEKDVSTLGLENNVRLLGVRTDVSSLMSAADVFALSSSWEGFGLVVAEAMATERVVVATDCGGVAQVLGLCGYLVPSEGIDQLADALTKALLLPCSSAREIGAAARARIVSEFELSLVVDRWLSIYTKY